MAITRHYNGKILAFEFPLKVRTNRAIGAFIPNGSVVWIVSYILIGDCLDRSIFDIEYELRDSNNELYGTIKCTVEYNDIDWEEALIRYRRECLKNWSIEDLRAEIAERETSGKEDS